MYDEYYQMILFTRELVNISKCTRLKLISPCHRIFLATVGFVSEFLAHIQTGQ